MTLLVPGTYHCRRGNSGPEGEIGGASEANTLRDTGREVVDFPSPGAPICMPAQSWMKLNTSTGWQPPSLST